jgi:phosphatidylinositol-3,4,5-trisphosphate 3-phosphatase/dual-specificity protein phosphatase PTEN
MASILRYCVALPKKQCNTGTGSLDLAYITPSLIVCSMPTSNIIKGWYRIWLKDLLDFLYEKHNSDWRIWNFQAEQTGYDDHEVFGKVEHFPFPDHNPPPFEMLPQIVCSIESHLMQSKNNVAILHCKAGKGRSGTVACAYLIMKFKMTFDQATQVFTSSRMRLSFGEGVSINSQRRYLRYTHDYVHVLNQQYKPIHIEIDEIKIYGQLYKDIDLKIARYTEGSRVISNIYQFNQNEVVDRTSAVVIFKPQQGRIVLSADICVMAQRTKVVGGKLPIIHSSAYMWFNVFFETYGSTEGFDFCQTNGRIEVPWKEMDGYKGTSNRGSELFEKIEVYWHVTKGSPQLD